MYLNKKIKVKVLKYPPTLGESLDCPLCTVPVAAEFFLILETEERPTD